jgi:AAA15 family ATPase/GTPase
MLDKKMLIQFTIENFLSFRDEVTFSMVAVNSDNQHSDHLAQNEAGEGRSVLPIAAIYGANAAGKSNLIKAINFVKELVVEGTRTNQSIPVTPFKLSDHGKKGSKFELIFTYQGSQYSYGFKLNKEQILEEWLYGIPKGKKTEVKYFERITSTSTKKETNVEFGTLLKGRSPAKGVSSKRHLNLEFIAAGTRYNQLFLTEAIDRSINILMPVFDWFKKALTVILAEAVFSDLEIGVDGNESFTDFLSKFLNSAGTGIDSIATEKVELDFDRHFLDMPKSIKDDLVKELDTSSEVMVENSLGGRFLVYKDPDNKPFIMRLSTRHRNEDGSLVDFSIQEESEGTQRLIHLIPSLFMLKQKNEKVIFIDELDRRLHPLLSRYFVESAINCRSKGNQLIFTTHDTNLLDLDLLRRDEIWFVEKKKNGVSDCYSLAEFKIRPDLKIEKGYLNARFGAIPFFGNPKDLGWFECEDSLSKKANR